MCETEITTFDIGAAHWIGVPIPQIRDSPAHLWPQFIFHVSPDLSDVATCTTKFRNQHVRAALLVQEGDLRFPTFLFAWWQKIKFTLFYYYCSFFFSTGYCFFCGKLFYCLFFENWQFREMSITLSQNRHCQIDFRFLNLSHEWNKLKSDLKFKRLPLFERNLLPN